MRTMFASQEKNGKKIFQKPNILRRKPKAPSKPTTPQTHESHSGKSLDNISFQTNISPDLHLETSVTKDSEAFVKKPVQRLSVENNTRKDDGELYKFDTDIKSNLSTSGNSILSNNNEEFKFQDTINIESFLNSSTTGEQNDTQYNIHNDEDNNVRTEWGIDFINGTANMITEDSEGCLEGNHEETSSVVTNTVSSTELSQVQGTSTESELTKASTQIFSLQYLASGTMNFKCDVPGCNKKFRSEQKLVKHWNVHNSKATKRTNVDCPVKKIDQDGKIELCGRTFPAREELMKHLNEEHSPDDAVYICKECGRRFFWATGLRAHGRAHGGGGRGAGAGGGGGGGAGAALACAWPGCGRVFRQPCRLREHARAHTGDKPYPCRYPNCPWSFRTASKLLRHARQHTGERRHACAACGRRFVRREHLRDHAARHHAGDHACTRAGCQRTFLNLDALYVHMKKVHKDLDFMLSTVQQEPALLKSEEEKTYMVSIDPSALETNRSREIELDNAVDMITDVADAEARAEAAARAAEAEAEAEETEWHAARTHCTWPLPPRTEPAPQDPVDTHYVLEEDVQVELSLQEGAESNIYTIRSDLFLHGNVLNNEDSGQMEGAEAGGPLLVVPGGDTDLELLDAHPTIDLMQEELMYTDAAVDESSFRVFLLSGDDLG